MATKMAGECFLEKWADDFVQTLQSKTLADIALSCTIFDINAFLHVTKNSRWSAKMLEEQFLKNGTDDCVHNPQPEIQLKSLYLHPLQDQCVFVFYTVIQGGHHKNERLFGKRAK